MGFEKLGKVKTEIDLDELLMAYYLLDETYIKDKSNGWKIAEDLNTVLLKLEKATGYEYFRTVRPKYNTKKEGGEKNNDRKK